MRESDKLFIILVVMFIFSSFTIIESGGNCNFNYCTNSVSNGTNAEQKTEGTIKPEGLQYNQDRFYSYVESYIHNIGINATNDEGGCIITKDSIVVSCYFIFTYNGEKAGHPLTNEELKKAFGEPVTKGD